MARHRVGPPLTNPFPESSRKFQENKVQSQPIADNAMTGECGSSSSSGRVDMDAPKAGPPPIVETPESGPVVVHPWKLDESLGGNIHYWVNSLTGQTVLWNGEFDCWVDSSIPLYASDMEDEVRQYQLKTGQLTIGGRSKSSSTTTHQLTSDCLTSDYRRTSGYLHWTAVRTSSTVSGMVFRLSSKSPQTETNTLRRSIQDTTMTATRWAHQRLRQRRLARNQSLNRRT
jgi:hypothetical protein